MCSMPRDKPDMREDMISDDISLQHTARATAVQKH